MANSVSIGSCRILAQVFTCYESSYYGLTSTHPGRAAQDHADNREREMVDSAGCSTLHSDVSRRLIGATCVHTCHWVVCITRSICLSGMPIWSNFRICSFLPYAQYSHRDAGVAGRSALSEMLVAAVVAGCATWPELLEAAGAQKRCMASRAGYSY